MTSERMNSVMVLNRELASELSFNKVMHERW
jgi:hypothetical protein